MSLVSPQRRVSLLECLYSPISRVDLTLSRRSRCPNFGFAILACLLVGFVGQPQFGLAQTKSSSSSKSRRSVDEKAESVVAKADDSNADPTLQLIMELTATKLIETYDSDQDGMLTREEMVDMAHAPIAPVFDTNGDSKLSRDELIESMRNPFAAEDAKASQRKKYEDYVSKLFERYDDDENGELDKNEVKKMPPIISGRSGRAPEESVDTDQDGMISFDELVNKLMGKPHSMSQTQKSKRQESAANRILEQAYKAKSDSSKKDKLNEASAALIRATELRQSGARSSQASINSRSRTSRAAAAQSSRSRSGGAVAGMMSSGRSASQTQSVAAQRNVPVQIELYLVHVSESIDAEKLESSIETAKNKSTDAAYLVNLLTGSLGLTSVDHMKFTSTSHNETEVSSGAEIPMVTGSSQNGSRRSVSVQRIDVGLQVACTPKIEVDYISLALALSKSDILDHQKASSASDEIKGDESSLSTPKIVSWTFQSLLRFDDEKPVVVTSSSSGVQWILVVSVKK